MDTKQTQMVRKGNILVEESVSVNKECEDNETWSAATRLTSALWIKDKEEHRYFSKIVSDAIAYLCLCWSGSHFSLIYYRNAAQ